MLLPGRPCGACQDLFLQSMQNVGTVHLVSTLPSCAASFNLPGQHRPIRCPKYELLLGDDWQLARGEVRPVAQTGMNCTAHTRECNITDRAGQHKIWKVLLWCDRADWELGIRLDRLAQL